MYRKIIKSKGFVVSDDQIEQLIELVRQNKVVYDIDNLFKNFISTEQP